MRQPEIIHVATAAEIPFGEFYEIEEEQKAVALALVLGVTKIYRLTAPNGRVTYFVFGVE
jgi:hypothetical protein